MATLELGRRLLASLIKQNDLRVFHDAKLTEKYFTSAEEKLVFNYVKDHVFKHGVLPALSTVGSAINELPEAIEPPSFYLDELETRYGYTLFNSTLKECSEHLKVKAIPSIVESIETSLAEFRSSRTRQEIMDFGKESHDLYKYLHDKNYSGDFRIKMGWPGLDSITNGLGEGDICSIVGATGSGKTFHALYVAHDIYFNQKKDVIFISMEMGKDILTQRLSAMITKSNLTEIEHGRETTHIQKNVKAALMGLQELPQKLYIVDGALSSTVEQVEALLQIYKPHALVIDGAYLMQHKNVKLDRYSRVGENIKALKALASKFKIPMVLSYQFNRKAAEKKKKGESAGLEDIGSSADIEQISSIVLALKQAESTETLKQRVISILKGRNGGDNATINIHWDFEHLNFSEIITATSDPSDASTDSHKYDTVDEFND